ncbi:hypothetical protein DdX_20628 [Ditylenchus destructor]|uniref:F-box domain-containing protein n=1 Tax=Ditylenchus destructor TaxID=166010 RepID=A0AAD4QW02_9BILA|nr:hypothetical protein DdX_20628 [Ditylenchus destructor]
MAEMQSVSNGLEMLSISSNRRAKIEMPNEVWLDVCSFKDPLSVDSMHLVNRHFHNLITVNSSRLPEKCICNVDCCWNEVTLNAKGAGDFISNVSIKVNENNPVEYVNALKQLWEKFGKYCIDHVSLCFSSLAVLQEMSKAFPKLQMARSLGIYNRKRDYGAILSIIIILNFNWHMTGMLRNARLRAIPHFSLKFVDDYEEYVRRPLRMPSDEDLMDFCFDFSQMGKEEPKDLKLECYVSDEFFSLLIKRFLAVDRNLTIELRPERSNLYYSYFDGDANKRPDCDDVYRPPRFNSDGYEETQLTKKKYSNNDEVDLTYYYKVIGTTEVQIFSHRWRFFITNDAQKADEMFKRSTDSKN